MEAIDLKTVENNRLHLQKFKELRNDTSFEKEILSIGFNLIKVIKKLDVVLAPMITNTYFICFLSATGFFYLSSGVLFLGLQCEVVLLSIAGISIAWLAIFRVYEETKYGHMLAKGMEKVVYHLDRFRLMDENINSKEMELLKEEFRYHCEAPIAPYSAFTLSTSSLLGQFGTIITYLIVLLQFRAS